MKIAEDYGEIMKVVEKADLIQKQINKLVKLRKSLLEYSGITLSQLSYYRGVIGKENFSIIDKKYIKTTYADLKQLLHKLN